MRIGFHLTPFWSPATRSATELIDESCGKLHRNLSADEWASYVRTSTPGKTCARLP